LIITTIAHLVREAPEQLCSDAFTT